MDLRLSVAIGVTFFTAIGVVSLADGVVRAGGRWPRLAGRGLRVAGIAFLLAAAGIVLQLARARWVDVALDWLPGVYLLAGYWLPARLSTRLAPRLQAHLEATDRSLFASGFGRVMGRAPRILLEYFEAAYLCCYVSVPAGLAWLYLAGNRGAADSFWTTVLLAALPCYALVTCCATQPPRRVEQDSPGDMRPLMVRRINLAVLDHASIGLNTFPSGHAAAAFGAALAVGVSMPAAGAVLGLVAVSIAVGSVAGRYHYALDAACGALVAIAAFAVSRLV